jgi:hypothetical protein
MSGSANSGNAQSPYFALSWGSTALSTASLPAPPDCAFAMAPRRRDRQTLCFNYVPRHTKKLGFVEDPSFISVQRNSTRCGTCSARMVTEPSLRTGVLAVTVIGPLCLELRTTTSARP